MLRQRILSVITGLLFCIVSMPYSLAEDLNQSIRDAFQANELPKLHGAIVDFQGRRLAQVYFPGEDEVWGKPVGVQEHSPDTLHDLRSVTKSVVGLLYGIALSEGKVPAPEEPLYKQFPEYADLILQPERSQILVEHALTMQLGLQWNEDLPYSDRRNSEIAMEWASDRYRYVLEQPVVEEPGKSWTYSGGAVALLGGLIEKGAGIGLDEFAAEKLFQPLGIETFEWTKGTDGVPSAASGLRLTLPDVAKIGLLIAEGGTYEGKQIVPTEWIKKSFQSKAKVNDFIRYGYLWYLIGPNDDLVVVTAVGNGGQRLTVQPNKNFVVASFAGRYNDPESWQTSWKVLSEFALPKVKRIQEN